MSVDVIHPSFRITKHALNKYIGSEEQLPIPLEGGATLYVQVWEIVQPYPLGDVLRRWVIGFGRIWDEDNSEGMYSIYKVSTKVANPRSETSSIPDPGFVRKVDWSEWDAIISFLNPSTDATMLRRPVWRSIDIPVDEQLPTGVTRKWLRNVISRLVERAQESISSDSVFTDCSYNVRQKAGKPPEVDLRSVVNFAISNGFRGFGSIKSPTLRKIKQYVDYIDETEDLASIFC